LWALKRALLIVGGLWALGWAWQTFFWVNRQVLMRKYISVKVFILARKLYVPHVWSVINCGRDGLGRFVGVKGGVIGRFVGVRVGVLTFLWVNR